MKDKLIISAYGSHNAAVSMFYKGQYTVIEVERWLNSKNAGLTTYLPVKNMQLVFDEICQYLIDQTDRSDVDVYIHGYMNKIVPSFKYHSAVNCDHHVAHAAGAFYQSDYRKSLVFTFDGGGDGGFFNVYTADRSEGIKLVGKFDQDLGFPYMLLADYLDDIKKESLSIGNLVYAGKLMGLCSYGKVREEWLPHFDAFYDKFNYTGDSVIGGAEISFDALTELFADIGVSFDFENSRFTGLLAWDIAATTQKAFENQFYKFARPFLDEYDLPICLSGGCALNVLLNTILLEERNGQVFVPPNTNDCGISIGALLWYNAPAMQVDLTYSGLPIMDDNRFSEYMESGKFTPVKTSDIREISKFIADGFIVGVIQGNSEHGSRALGNRSIICNPIEGMKDTLNQKVKNREWYRPFAPIVRVEDTQTYFNFHGTESRHMTYVAEVRDEWKSTLPAITHEDGTGRLQTVTRAQNEFIYDLITHFAEYAGHGVILNTSFNVNGKPILTRLSDALEILEKSKLDCVYYKGYMIFRRGEEQEFLKNRKDTNPFGTEINGNTTIHLLMFDDVLSQNLEKYKYIIEGLAELKDTHINIITDVPSSLVLSKDELGHHVHSVGNNRHYYSPILTKHVSGLTDTMSFAPHIKLLWAKEAMRENKFNTNNHVFIDLQNIPNINVQVAVENIIANITAGGHAAESSLVAATRKVEYTKTFDQDFYGVKWHRLPNSTFKSSLIGGQIEGLDWLFTNYEGVMNWYANQGKIGTESDYLTVSSMDNPDKIRPFFV